MNIFKLAGIAAITVLAAWSCEKAEIKTDVQPQQETSVECVNPTDLLIGTNGIFDTAFSGVDLKKIGAAVKDLSEAPDSIFPAKEIKDAIINLLRSVLPEDLSLGFNLPFIYSSLDNTFEIMGELSRMMDFYLDPDSGLYEVGPDNSGYVSIFFETPDGDDYVVMFSKGEADGYAGIKTSKTIEDYILVRKNDEVLFSFFVYDDKDVLKSFASEEGFMYSHVHSGELQISAVRIALDFDTDFRTGDMSYEMSINLGDIGISIPMIDTSKPLMYIKGDFKKTGTERNSKIAANQTISMAGLITFHVTTADLAKMVSLMASTITLQNPGMSEYMCNKYVAQWDETGTDIEIEIGNEGEGGSVYLGCAPVHEDNPYFNLYAPCLYVYLYAYMDEVTLPEFLELLSTMIPEL